MSRQLRIALLCLAAMAHCVTPRGVPGGLHLRGGVSGLGEYGKVEECAVDSLLSCHLAPTRRLFELVDDGNGVLSTEEVKKAAAELEIRRQALASMPLVNTTFEYRYGLATTTPVLGSATPNLHEG